MGRKEKEKQRVKGKLRQEGNDRERKALTFRGMHEDERKWDERMKDDYNEIAR